MSKLEIRLVDKYEVRPKILLDSDDKNEVLKEIEKLLDSLLYEKDNLVGFYISMKD